MDGANVRGRLTGPRPIWGIARQARDACVIKPNEQTNAQLFIPNQLLKVFHPSAISSWWQHGKQDFFVLPSCFLFINICSPAAMASGLRDIAKWKRWIILRKILLFVSRNFPIFDQHSINICSGISQYLFSGNSIRVAWYDQTKKKKTILSKIVCFRKYPISDQKNVYICS